MLDHYYISVFNHYKKSLGKRSLTIALTYIIVLELSIILALAAFFMAFASQMRMTVMSSTKFWILFALVALFVLFKNWMRYNGKKRNVLNAKTKAKRTSIYLLWLLPLGCYIISFILLQVK
jgi:H+/Cl- antiporter ClcA